MRVLGRKVLGSSCQETWRIGTPRQNFRDLGPRKGGRRLLEEPWPSSLAPSGGPGGSEPSLNKVLLAYIPFLTDKD